jgi:hypothetical protein
MPPISSGGSFPRLHCGDADERTPLLGDDPITTRSPRCAARAPTAFRARDQQTCSRSRRPATFSLVRARVATDGVRHQRREQVDVLRRVAVAEEPVLDTARTDAPRDSARRCTCAAPPTSTRGRPTSSAADRSTTPAPDASQGQTDPSVELPDLTPEIHDDGDEDVVLFTRDITRHSRPQPAAQTWRADSLARNLALRQNSPAVRRTSRTAATAGAEHRARRRTAGPRRRPSSGRRGRP